MTDEDLFPRAIAAWNEGGFDAFAAHLAPDVVWHAPPEYPEGEVWHRREAIAGAWRAQFDSVFDSYRTEITELEGGPRAWFSATRTSGQARGSGMQLDWTTYFVGHIEDGLFKELRLFLDRAEARRKAGLEP
jgi:ketosteroid isomerase-like protein